MEQQLAKTHGVGRIVVVRHPHHGPQEARESEVHRRAGEGDKQLARGLPGYGVKLRHAPDGHQQDPPHADAEVHGRERVPEFVQHHAGEKCQQDAHAPQELLPAAGLPALVGGIGEQQKETRVHGELDTPDAEQVD